MAMSRERPQDTRVSDPSAVTPADVERLAALIGFPIDPAHRAATARQLTILFAAARLLEEFPLNEDVAPAPEFQP
jgi:hypothetical protein